MHRTFSNSFITLILASSILVLPTAASAAEPVLETKPAATAPSVSPAPATPVAPTEPKASAAAPDTAPGSPAVPAPPLPDVLKSEKPQALPLQAPSAVRFGFADLGRISQESKQGKKAQAQVKSKKEKYQAQITAKQKQLEKQKSAIEEKLPTMASNERAAKAKEFEKRVEEYRKFVQKAENEMKLLQEQATRTLFQDIQKAAAAYGKANGFTAIITLNEILYLGTGVLPEDVTTAVLKQMKEQ